MFLPEVWAQRGSKWQLRWLALHHFLLGDLQQEREHTELRMMPQIQPTPHPSHTSHLREGNKLGVSQEMLTVHLED